MKQTYICAGSATGPEVYRSHFTHFGFRYTSLAGFPGVPDETTLTAHFIHSAVPQSGQFSSSSATLNAVQHATRYAALSNLMDVPTDCPQVCPRGVLPAFLYTQQRTFLQRERRGWLGDAQLAFETFVHNVDGGAFCGSRAG